MEKEIIKGIERGSLSFLAGTFCSRVSGVVRDVAMAAFLGSAPSLAAFMVSYRLANLFRRLLGEGPLPAGFIPHFEMIRKECPKKGALFFRDAFFSIGLILLAVLVLSELGIFLFLKQGNFSEGTREILYLMGLMMPGMVFICLYGITSALLQCEKKFFLSGVAPVFFNLVWIVGVLLGASFGQDLAAVWLSIAVVFGFFLQWLSLVPALKQYFNRVLSMKEVISFSPFSSAVRGVMKPLGMSILGVGATQINSALDALFARSASLEGPAYLWYAIRIEQLPLALFGIALSTALLPSLSRACSSEDNVEFLTLLRFALQRSFVILLPCTLGLICLASCGVNLLYGRGGFSMEATQQTIYCLWGYGLGLLPSVFVLLQVQAFYAKKNYRIPMLASMASVVMNIVCNALFVFVFKWGAVSIALATSLAAFGNFFFLLAALHKEKSWSGFGSSLTIVKTVFCSLMATGASLYVESCFLESRTLVLFFSEEIPLFNRVFLEQIGEFVLLGSTFSFVFLLLAYLVDLKEVLKIVGIKKRTEEVG